MATVPVREVNRNFDAKTMRVREIEDVLDDLRKMLVSKLPGNRERMALWATVNEAARTIEFAKMVLAEEDENPKERPPVLTYRTWEYHGHVYAMSTLIRRVADEMGVSNFEYREVPDAEGAVSVAGTGPALDPGTGGAGQAG